MMDNRGNITLEIAVFLIIILIVFGIVLNSVENTTGKVMSASEKEHLELLTSEVTDNLINNPGNPDNWNELGFGTPGLSVVNEQGESIPNSVSYFKLIALGKDYKKLVDEELFDSKLKTSIELVPQKSSISSVKIGDEDTSNNIVSVNRLVKCDFYNKYVIKNFENDGKCNRNHDQSQNSCNYFKIFKSYIRNSDYYLLIDDEEVNDLKYYIDTTRIVKQRYWENANTDCIYLNDEINFYDDRHAVVFIHFDKPKAKAVLVSVPKNFDESKLNYDYFTVNNCELILRAWY